jgi:exodeoxyribonuclease VII large subunit
MMGAMQEKVYSVSEITGLIKDSLESGFPFVCVEGEISNFRPASSGHVYFSLKDRDALIQAVMFRGKAMALRFQPADGILVRIRGALSVYPARGNYQVICESMEQSGEGAILAMLEERKRRLAAEGLFDQDRKRPIPAFPETVAVITSPTGAAVRDILNIVKRRNSGMRIIILPTAVQGTDAPAQIVQMLKIANAHSLGDVIILSRGGGSLEDLLPFSDEEVVRAVAASGIPVISAVGHEVDWSLSDFAADLRAPTPSAAAELVSAERDQTLDRVIDLRESLTEGIRGRIEGIRSLLGHFSQEELEYKFRNRYQPLLMRFDDAKEGLFESIRSSIQDKHHRLERAFTAIEASDPTAILSRGYSIVTDAKTGATIRSSKDIQPGELVGLRFHSGRAAARIQETDHEEV